MSLCPPYLDGTIPSFYKENGTVKIAVPFSHNRTVSSSDINGYKLKIKNIQSSSFITVLSATESAATNGVVYFTLDNTSLLKQGLYYKFQLAYVDTTDEIGYYSTVATGKYTYKPTVEIEQLSSSAININTYEYVGKYTNSSDTTEKVYNYYFTVYDNAGNIIKQTDTLLHNVSADTTTGESYDSFSLGMDLETNSYYYIEYTVITNNGLEISSPKYQLMQQVSIDPAIQATLDVSLNYDNGYIDINLIGKTNENNVEVFATGDYTLLRSSESSNYTSWEEIFDFSLHSQKPTRHLWRDFTVEQGKHYQYAIHEYNDIGLFSNKIKSDIIYADFEDAFLFDGEKQLKIKYNPKVSSFKTTVLEQKLDTIGGQHPFIFRNGRTNYKEFQISGLISYMMDEENLFFEDEEILLNERTTNLVSENISSERLFKLKVLEWLNNGKEKIFRSPVEGNYIIRLMNITLSPTDTLGRMLHTFNGTAYEVAEFSYENLTDYDFITYDDPAEVPMRWKTVTLSNLTDSSTLSEKTIVEDSAIYNIKCYGMTPGTIFEFTYADNTSADIAIGVTGSYSAVVEEPISKIVIKNVNNSTAGTLTYGYKVDDFYSLFNRIESIEVENVPDKQFIGEHNIMQELTSVYYDSSWVTNPKVNITNIMKISAQVRDIYEVYYKSGKFYTDKECNTELNFETDIKDCILYHVFWVITSTDGDPDYPTDIDTHWHYEDLGYIEGKNVEARYQDGEVDYEPSEYNTILTYGGSDITDIEDAESIELRQINHYNIELNEVPGILQIGCGLMADITYQRCIVNYTYEDSTAASKDADTVSAKSTYTSALTNFKTALNASISDLTTWGADVITKENAVNTAYNTFIYKLQTAKSAEEESVFGESNYV